MRPRARMLTLGVSAWFVAGSVAAIRTHAGAHDSGTPMPELGQTWGDAIGRAGSAGAIGLEPWIASWSSIAIVIAVAAVAVAVLVGAIVGKLGAVDRNEARRLGTSVHVPTSVWSVAVGLFTLVGIAWACSGVLAGAARAPAASPAGVTELWATWAVRLPAVAGTILVLAGLVELLLEHRARRRALFLSVEEARRERQAHGGRRR